MPTDLDVLTQVVSDLDPKPRPKRWTHLSLCVIDAVFSIGARYSGTTRTVWRYADDAGLAAPLLPTEVATEVIGSELEEPLGQMVGRADAVGADSWRESVLDNRQRTSTRFGIPKADAAYRYAQVLTAQGVEKLGDVAGLMHDSAKLSEVEDELARVPGHGNHGVRLGYLWMLAGDDQLVKPDRMVLRWLRETLGRSVCVAEARPLVIGAAHALGLSPWAVDHAIWLKARSPVRRG